MPPKVLPTLPCEKLPIDEEIYNTTANWITLCSSDETQTPIRVLPPADDDMQLKVTFDTLKGFALIGNVPRLLERSIFVTDEVGRYIRRNSNDPTFESMRVYGCFARFMRDGAAPSLIVYHSKDI